MVKKVHLVTGKGGVGKSLFSAVLARYFSNKGQHTLLCELGAHSFFKDYLGLEQISYKPTNWKPNLDISQWTSENCLKEYTLHLLKSERLYKMFFENPVSKSLIQVAPGLHELALLGKITSSPRQQGPPMFHEQIVVDSFSTGHFLSLLRAPAALSKAIPFGPMGEQAKSIDLWIRNPEFTEVHIVTLAEELPLTESIELFQQLKKEFNIHAKVYLNKISQLTLTELADLPEESQDLVQDWTVRELLKNILTLESNARGQLKNAQIEFIELPLITSLKVEVLLQKLIPYLGKPV